MPDGGRIGDGDRDLVHARGLDARASGGQAAVPDADGSIERDVGRRQRRLIREGAQVSSRAHRMADLLEPLGGEEDGLRPGRSIAYTGRRERQQRDQGHESDREHGERGQDLCERQPLFFRKEGPQL